MRFLPASAVGGLEKFFAENPRAALAFSGGVDSAYTAALLAEEGRDGEKKAYTVGFGLEEEKYDERAKAGKIAKACGLLHKSRLIQEREFWSAVPEVMYYLDEPLGDPSAVALYFLSREAAREVKAVVSGEGADELFGGYRIYCEPAALEPYQRLPEKFRKAAARLAERLPDVKGKQFLIRGAKSVEERFIGNANIFSWEERRRLLKGAAKAAPPAKLLERDYERTRGMRDADRMQEIDLRHWLAGDILLKADRMSMAHSLELRVPFLDREVFALARRLPGSQKQRGRGGRAAEAGLSSAYPCVAPGGFRPGAAPDRFWRSCRPEIFSPGGAAEAAGGAPQRQKG